MALDLVAGGKEDGAAAQFLLRLHQFKADERPAFRCLQVFAEAQFLADDRAFPCRHLAEAKIIQRIAMIEFKARHMALLDAQARPALRGHRA